MDNKYNKLIIITHITTCLKSLFPGGVKIHSLSRIPQFQATLRSLVLLKLCSGPQGSKRKTCVQEFSIKSHKLTTSLIPDPPSQSYLPAPMTLSTTLSTSRPSVVKGSTAAERRKLKFNSAAKLIKSKQSLQKSSHLY